jgi:hypothetical protein
LIPLNKNKQIQTEDCPQQKDQLTVTGS